jgi:dipeptidyl aminopeptidase/acylaminoacyl peptidase
MNRFYTFLLIVLMSFSSVAQGVMTPNLLWDLGRVGGGSLSPDGTTLVFSVSRYSVEDNKGESNLYSVDVASGEMKQLTTMPGSEHSVQWHPDGSRIGFIHAGQWHEMPAEGGEPVKVSNFNSTVSNVKYAPTGDRLLYTKEVKIDLETIDMYPDYPEANALIYDELMYRHWNQWTDGYYSHVHYVDYEDGQITGEGVDIMAQERFDSPLNPFGGSEAVTWSADGLSIIYACKKLNGAEYARSTNGDLYQYNIQTAETTNLTSFNKGYDNDAQFSPDGKYMAWLSMARDGYESDQNRLMLMDLKSGESASVMKNPEATVGGYSWSADSKTLFVEMPTNATQQVYAIDVFKKWKDNSDESEYSIKQISSGTFNYGVPMDAGKYLVASTHRYEPRFAEYYRIDKKTGEASELNQGQRRHIYNGIAR